MIDKNIDDSTVAGFGDEWKRFDQSPLLPEERQKIFDSYFSVFPWKKLTTDSVGFDLGCGSGRALYWNRDSSADRIGIDASPYFSEEASKHIDLVVGDLRRLPVVNGAFTKAAIAERSRFSSGVPAG